MARATTDTDRLSEFSGTAIGEMLSRSSAKDRATLLKHLDFCRDEPDQHHAKTWRRLVSSLSTLAPLPVQVISLDSAGQNAMLFFIPDGKYRMQMFALEDRRDGTLQLYLPDVLQQATKAKVITKKGAQYAAGEPLAIELLDASNCPDPGKHFKHMIGWNRKAVRITLSASNPSEPQLSAAEQICTLAVKPAK